jgi:hypothetical protein
MARKLGKQTTRPRIKVVSQAGRPAATVEKTTFAQKLPRLPQFSKRNIRKLQKVDVSKGITMPEANDMTTAAGVRPLGPQTTRLVRQAPNVPVQPDKNQRVVKPPRAGGGVLKVFGKNRKVRNTSIRRK